MSDNATRLALGIPDVLQEIFSHFSPVQCWGTAIPPLCEYDISTNVFRVDRTSLAYCAQVCKSWSPYALDVLWAALPYRISPLLGLFPGFRQSSLSVSEERSLAATIEGHVYQISELDLRRFQQYAFRVKCVLYHRRHYHQSPQCDSVTDSYQFKEDCESTLLAQLCELNGGQL
ncbi:hypothetical protein K466DRAFT_591909 [Polyporus arcularius HHB13444]|uniref:F-box domain-containing protein n=1 Tax=Polyporus arcularius HHB13444 TaxID=1314778 RepID=A0A5C3NU59_9APHY|nr:hypothetical protein K466DRAFT_591909 [Polyporus arcularius HHB13444]